MEHRDDLYAGNCLLEPVLIPTGDIHDSFSQGCEPRPARVHRVVRSNH
jgi:hypothetical protein